MIGTLATILALFVPSVYGMFILAADVIFVIMLPQLSAVLFISCANTYGAMSGYFIGLLLRLGAGEPYLSLPAILHYPGYSSEMGQLFPFRTFSMLCSFLSIILISKTAEWVFTNCGLSQKYDVFKCFTCHAIDTAKNITCASNGAINEESVGLRSECLNDSARVDKENLKNDSGLLSQDTGYL